MTRTTTRVFLLGMLVAALWPAGLSAAPTEEDPASELSLMSFNIKQHNPTNPKLVDSPNRWELRKEIVFDIIRDHSPDIVAIQEAYRHQRDDLLAALPDYRSVGEGRDGGPKGEFCPILYQTERFRVEESGTFWLSDTPEKPSRSWDHFYHRICTWVRLTEKPTGRTLHVFNTHLDHQSQIAREKSARLISHRIRDRKDKSLFILAGDLNAGEDNPVVTYLKGKHEDRSPAPMVDSFRVTHPDTKDCGTGSQFTGASGGPKIDYLFLPPSTEVLDAEIIRTQFHGRYPSDHYPVTTTIRLAP